MHGKIPPPPPRCVPSESVSQSAIVSILYAHFVVHGLVKSAHLFWLPKDQWHRRDNIHKDSIKFLTFTVILTLKTTIKFLHNTPAYDDEPSN